MAPKAAKVEVLKKPTAKSGLLKKNEEKKTPKGLTLKQVKNHNGKNQDTSLKDRMEMFIQKCKEPGATPEIVEGFLQELPTSDQQAVWKQFERDRIMNNTDQAYKSATSGNGSWSKKRALLFAWGASNKEAKGNTWSTALAEVSTEKEDKLESTWQPLAAMMAKYGKDELLSHLQCGSIVMQRHPKNPKFFQFKDEVASVSAKNIQKNALGHQKQGASDSEAMRSFMKQNFLEDASVMKQLQDGDFGVAESEPPSEEEPETDLATLLGLKKQTKKKGKEEEEIQNKLTKKPNAIGDRFTHDVDKNSEVGDDETHEKALKKAKVIMAMLINTHDASAELMNTTENKNVEKAMSKHIDALLGAHDNVQKMLKKADKTKVPAIKDLLQSSAKILKAAHAAIKQHGA